MRDLGTRPGDRRKLGRSNPRALPVTASLPGSFKKDRSRRYRPRREGDRQLMSPPAVRQFVPAQRVLRLTSPRPKPPHGKARAGMLYPNRYFLLRDIYRTVLKRESTGAIRATNIFPGDPRKSRRALALLIRQLVATGEGILGLVRPKAKTLYREECVGPSPPNVDHFLPDGYRAAPIRKAA